MTNTHTIISRDPRAEVHVDLAIDLGMPASARDRMASLRAYPTLGADVRALGVACALKPEITVPAASTDRVGFGFGTGTGTPVGTSVSSPPI